MTSPEQQAWQVWDNLMAVRSKINRAATWQIVDVDPMANEIAYVFYVRSNSSHRFTNALDDQVQCRFDTSVLVPTELIVRSPERAASYVLDSATDALKRSKL